MSCDPSNLGSTHHHACACREAAHAARIAELEAQVAQAQADLEHASIWAKQGHCDLHSVAVVGCWPCASEKLTEIRQRADGAEAKANNFAEKTRYMRDRLNAAEARCAVLEAECLDVRDDRHLRLCGIECDCAPRPDLSAVAARLLAAQRVCESLADYDELCCCLKDDGTVATDDETESGWDVVLGRLEEWREADQQAVGE